MHLTVYFQHDTVGYTLTNLARLTMFYGLSPHFARRLRKTFFTLSSDILFGNQARNILRNHIRQALLKIWKTIHYNFYSKTNGEFADYIVQAKESIERWDLYNSNYHQSNKHKSSKSFNSLTNKKFPYPQFQGLKLLVQMHL